MTPTSRSAPTSPKWWTSSLLVPLLLLTGCLLIADAPAGKRKKKRKNKHEEEPPVEVVPKPAPEASTPLFPSALPISAGGVPKGLANLSSQGCAACHFESHATWAESRHALGWRDEAFVAAVQAAAEPSCDRCHLPLIEQRPRLYATEDGMEEADAFTLNPAFSATLRTEGVNCITCHVRDGVVLTTTPREERGEAPHPLALSTDLADGTACASCHQLQWPGSNAPFYDTFGEWSRSPWKAAGVGCSDCHGGAGAGHSGFDHRGAATAPALSVLVDVERLEIVRGDAAVPLQVVLQNTGAGHSYPTGSPFTGVEVAVQLIGPPKRRSNEPTVVEVLTRHLHREIEPKAPWNVVGDHRIEAGGTATLEGTIELGQDLPEGRWDLAVRFFLTRSGERTTTVLRETTLPVTVE